jgi:hypothetical protein
MHRFLVLLALTCRAGTETSVYGTELLRIRGGRQRGEEQHVRGPSCSARAVDEVGLEVRWSLFFVRVCCLAEHQMCSVAGLHRASRWGELLTNLIRKTGLA